MPRRRFRVSGSAPASVKWTPRERRRRAPGYYGGNYNGGYAYGGNYYYGGNAFAGNYVQEGLRQQQMARTQVKVQEKAAGATAARAIVQDITNATAEVRRQMTEKYKIEF